MDLPDPLSSKLDPSRSKSIQSTLLCETDLFRRWAQRLPLKKRDLPDPFFRKVPARLRWEQRLFLNKICIHKKSSSSQNRLLRTSQTQGSGRSNCFGGRRLAYLRNKSVSKHTRKMDQADPFFHFQTKILLGLRC